MHARNPGWASSSFSGGSAWAAPQCWKCWPDEEKAGRHAHVRSSLEQRSAMDLGIRCCLLLLASMLRSWMSEMTSMRSTEGLASGTDGSAMETEAEGVMEKWDWPWGDCLFALSC